MERKIENESIEDGDQILSYFNADREKYKHLFKVAYKMSTKEVPKSVIDIGCGPGDLTYEMSKLYPGVVFTGVDTSKGMLSLSNNYNSKNLKFLNYSIRDITGRFDRAISSLTLHHFHDPMEFWNSIKKLITIDFFVIDLLRPSSEQKLQQRLHMGDYSPEFRLDYEASMRAAFSLEEINKQIEEYDFEDLTVMEINRPELYMDLVLITGKVSDEYHRSS